jgi:hypothetical protein
MVVDNFFSGGVAVPVDLERKFMTPIGMMQNDKIAVHMRSGLTFGGQPVPLLTESIAVVCRLHAKLAVRTLGWNVAMLKDGPCVIGAKYDWSPWVSLQLTPGYVERFLHYHVPDEPEWAAKFVLEGEFREFDHLRLWVADVAGRARVYGRIDELSRERAVVTVAGPRSHCDAVMHRLRRSWQGFDVRKVTAWRSADKLRPGFDMSASFAAPGHAVAPG